MIRPTDADIGSTVIYHGCGARGSETYDRRAAQGEAIGGEEGVITSVTRNWVFVRYRGDNTSKATRREDLEWLVMPEPDDKPS